MAVRVKTGGRKKGSRNKASVAKAQAIAASGLTPLDYMLGVMRDAKADVEMRLEAAKSAAPYVHPKLATIEVTGKDGKDLVPEPPSLDDVARRIAFLLSVPKE